MADVCIPRDFTPAASMSVPDHENLDVIFVPGPKDTHFQLGTAYYERDRHHDARWRFIGGDGVCDFGLKVLAWRRQRADMIIVRMDGGQPDDKDGYERAIAILAREHVELRMGGERDDRPKGVALISKLFGISAEQIQADYVRIAAEQMASGRH
jgi:hypothetical protein